MSSTMNLREGKLVEQAIVVALETIADEGSEVEIEALAKKAGAEPSAVVAALRMLGPLGVLRVAVDGATASVTGEEARNFLRSFASMLRNETVLIEDWHREGALCRSPEDIFERGVCLLGLIEKRRSSVNPKEKPVRVVDVSKALVKAISTNNSMVFLTILNDRSHRLQLVGGRQRPGESPEKTLHRELLEELPQLSLKEKDYTAAIVQGSPFIEVFVSPTHGVLTTFRVTYFHLTFHRSVRLADNQRWVTLDELVDGKTSDGLQIVPSSEIEWVSRAQLVSFHPSITERVKKAHNLTSLAPPSLPSRSSATRLVIATACGSTLLAITLGAISLAMHVWREHLAELLAIGIPTLILLLAFVGLAAGLIGGEQFLDAIRIARPGAHPKRNEEGRVDSTSEVAHGD